MSLNSLTSSRVARDVRAPVAGRDLSTASEDAVGPKQEDVQNALSALVEYVPAETVTLYLATVSALPVLTAAVPALNALVVYLAFAALTPVLFALIYAGKRRAAGVSRSPGWRQWPWWSMVAATIAFLAWGLAVPDGPFAKTDSGRVLGGLAAIVVSTLLGVLGRFFAPKP